MADAIATTQASRQLRFEAYVQVISASLETRFDRIRRLEEREPTPDSLDLVEEERLLSLISPTEMTPEQAQRIEELWSDWTVTSQHNFILVRVPIPHFETTHQQNAIVVEVPTPLNFLATAINFSSHGWWPELKQPNRKGHLQNAFFNIPMRLRSTSDWQDSDFRYLLQEVVCHRKVQQSVLRKANRDASKLKISLYPQEVQDRIEEAKRQVQMEIERDLQLEAAITIRISEMEEFRTEWYEQRDAASAARRHASNSVWGTRRDNTITSLIEEVDIPDDEPCSICYEPFQESNEEAVKLPCLHIFGKSCIITWLKEYDTCPMCRHDFFKQPNEADEEDDETDEEDRFNRLETRWEDESDQEDYSQDWEDFGSQEVFDAHARHGNENISRELFHESHNGLQNEEEQQEESGNGFIQLIGEEFEYVPQRDVSDMSFMLDDTDRSILELLFFNNCKRGGASPSYERRSRLLMEEDEETRKTVENQEQMIEYVCIITQPSDGGEASHPASWHAYGWEFSHRGD